MRLSVVFPILLIASIYCRGAAADGGPVASGASHTCKLEPNGTVVCWGNNIVGQLGTGATGPDAPAPVAVEGLTNVAAVASGYLHSCALKPEGSVLCWGNNDEGQIGAGALSAPVVVPAPVESVIDAIAISAGAYHTCALREGGSVACWGANNQGQLGVGTAGASQPAQEPVATAEKFIAISAGLYHTCALKAGGAVLCWGANGLGQAGIGAASAEPITNPLPVVLLDDAISVSSGGEFTCALRQTGEVACWGANGYGQLGVGSAGSYEPSPQPLDSNETFLALSSGDGHACAVKSEGGVMCWGHNAQGQLGIGIVNASQASPQPVAGLANVAWLDAGENHTCVQDEDGKVFCWGYNFYGQLGGGTAGTEQADPQAVKDLAGASIVVAGHSHTCAVAEEGAVQCWGRGREDQLGQPGPGVDKAVPVVPPALANFPATIGLAAGESHSCALHEDGKVTCWGANDFGQLGRGFVGDDETNSIPEEVSFLTHVTAISAGANHTCALRVAAMTTVVCWGRNNQGQLGNTFAGIPQPSPQTVSSVINPAAITTGADYSCAKRADGSAWCWGDNDYGQLGRGVQSTFEASPAAVESLVGVVSIDAGHSHTCAITSAGGSAQAVRCWGRDADGELGNGDADNGQSVPSPGLIKIGIFSYIALGELSSCVKPAFGPLECWGKNHFGQLGFGDFVSRQSPAVSPGFAEVKAVAIGAGHACAIDADDKIICAGSAEFGQRGDGAMSYFASPQPVDRGELFRDGFEQKP